MYLDGDLMLDVVSLWFNQLREMSFHGVLNGWLASNLGLFLLVPVAGSVALGLLHALRR